MTDNAKGDPETSFSGSSTETYLMLARMAIELCLDADELRVWWKEQEMDRANNFVSEEQERELVILCRRKIEQLTFKRTAERKRRYRPALI
jgi:hypothetical protein